MLFEATDLRIDVDGIPVVDGLSFAVGGRHALVTGAPRALYEAATGQRPVTRGTLRVSGAEPEGAAGRQEVAGVPVHVPVPPGWTTTEYVSWNARLAGASKKEAVTRAAAAIETLKLGETAKQRLDRVPLTARRAALVAAALATGAKTFLLEDPLSELAEDVADGFARVLREALDQHAWLVFTPTPLPFGSPFTLGAEHALAIAGARAELLVPPIASAAPPRRFTARLGPAQARYEEFVASLAARGGRADQRGGHVHLELGETLTTAEVLGLALEAELVFLELLPSAVARPEA